MMSGILQQLDSRVCMVRWYAVLLTQLLIQLLINFWLPSANYDIIFWQIILVKVFFKNYFKNLF